MAATASGQQNLAHSAHALASESQESLTPEKAIDGRLDTRWSGIPGHNSGVWYELDWDNPVTVGEVLVRQYQRYTFEWDVQVWDSSASDWRTVQHFGQPSVKLPGLVLCTIDPPVSTSKVRIANITNGPSFTEVEVYASPHAHPPTFSLASDLRGNFVGMVCDGVGATPIASKAVRLEGNGWSTYAITDEHGLFFAKMPVKLSGSVRVSSDGIHPQLFDAALFQRSVTPIDAKAKPTVLDSGWKFRGDPPKGFERPGFRDAGWSPIKVPAHWEMEGFRVLSGIGGYRKHFRTPVGSGRLMLRFDGVYSGADVWVNGHHLAYHEGGFTPFEMDVTDVVNPVDNVVALRVKEHTNASDNLDKMSQYADFPLAGIMRKVTLFRVPDVHVEAYEHSCRFSRATAQITGNLSIINQSGDAAYISALVSLLDARGHEVVRTSTKTAEIAAYDRGEQPFSFDVSKPRGWSAEKPYLYTLRIQLREDGRAGQTLDQPVGLRQTTIKGTQLLINGSPVKFRGTCHHDSHPTMGRAVTPDLTRLDLELIKKANLNAVRTSHYPPIPELVEYADEMGLYVEDEADFCWVGVADDLRNAPRILQLTGELLARDRNHPSVFMWSLCNESDFGYDFERSHEWVRKIDPSRPTGAATSAWLEIATLHNPISLARLKEVDNLDKPLMWDESWCIYQGIFNDVAEMWVDPGMRDYYAEPLPRIWDAFMKSKTVSGSMIWAWSDDLFCVPHRGLEYGRSTTQSHFVENEYAMEGRGLVGDAPWGVVDGWRREKPEYWITKKLQSPVKLTEVDYVPGQPTVIPARNEYDFTNLSDLVVTYSSGARAGKVHPNIPPRSSGTITIPASKDPGPLTVQVSDLHGDLIDEFRFEQKRSRTRKVSGGSGLVVRDESMLAGDSTHIIGRDFELAFDKDGGWLRRCVAGLDPLLLEFPSLHVLPTNSPLHALPDRLGWHLDSMAVSGPQSRIKVVLNGHYPEFAGSYEFEITPDGRMTVHSKFTYSGPGMLAREIGIRFSVPKTCDVLSWDREAEWNSYPEDHIGRPRGSAPAFATHPIAVPPTWAFSQDNSPMGSNDFRSTKRHIHSGSICYPSGAGVEIDSDGKQSLRAIVEPDRITVHMNDWFGGTNVGWGEWISNYGRGKQIKTGDVLESTVYLRLKKKDKSIPAFTTAVSRKARGPAMKRR